MPFGQIFVLEHGVGSISEVLPVRGKKFKNLCGEGSGCTSMCVLCSNSSSIFVSEQPTNSITEVITAVSASESIRILVVEDDKTKAYVWNIDSAGKQSSIAISGHSISQVAAGSRHALLLSESGSVYAFGRNIEGQCGMYSKASSVKSLGLELLVKPRSVPLRKRMNRVSCGSHFSLALSIDGDVFAWGENLCCQCAQETCSKILSPVQVIIPAVVTNISCGWGHAGAVTEAGAAYCWGLNSHGQIGDGREESVSTPYQIQVPAVERIVCQGHQTAALANGGSSVLHWGRICEQHHSRLPTELVAIQRMKVVVSDIAMCQARLMFSVPSAVYFHQVQLSSMTLTMTVGGFWPSDSIIVRFVSPSAEDPPRSSLGEFTADSQTLTCQIPPLQKRSDPFRVDIAVDGKHFFRTGVDILIP